MQEALDWDDLRILLAVQEGGSFAAAARTLKVDQATVGRRVAGLEAALGAPLFERLRSGLVLTSTGSHAVQVATEMGALTVRLRDQIESAEPEVEGVVRIAAPETLASGLLAPKLPALRQRYPQLRLEIAASQSAADLEKRDADVALRLFRPAQPSLVVRRMGRLAVGLYAHRDYVRARGRATLQTLRDHDLLGYDDSLTHTPHGRWFLEAGAGRFALRTNSAYALLAAARCKAGVAVLPCVMADGYRELVRVVGPDVVPSPEIWLVVHEARKNIPRLRTALAFISEALEEARSALEGVRRR